MVETNGCAIDEQNCKRSEFNPWWTCAATRISKANARARQTSKTKTKTKMCIMCIISRQYAAGPSTMYEHEKRSEQRPHISSNSKKTKRISNAIFQRFVVIECAHTRIGQGRVCRVRVYIAVPQCTSIYHINLAVCCSVQFSCSEKNTRESESETETAS